MAFVHVVGAPGPLAVVANMNEISGDHVINSERASERNVPEGRGGGWGETESAPSFLAHKRVLIYCSGPWVSAGGWSLGGAGPGRAGTEAGTAPVRLSPTNRSPATAG